MLCVQGVRVARSVTTRAIPTVSPVASSIATAVMLLRSASATTSRRMPGERISKFSEDP
jgi:hypothetical protein